MDVWLAQLVQSGLHSIGCTVRCRWRVPTYRSPKILDARGGGFYWFRKTESSALRLLATAISADVGDAAKRLNALADCLRSEPTVRANI